MTTFAKEINNNLNSKVQINKLVTKKNKNIYNLEFEIEGINYVSYLPIDIHVPFEWMTNEKEKFYDGKFWKTGPYHCNYCKKNGFYNGVFIGYCNICAEIHDYERGLGLFGHLTMEKKPYEAECATNNWGNIYRLPGEKSMWKTYMKNVEMSEIGDEYLKNKYINFYYTDDVEKDNYYSKYLIKKFVDPSEKEEQKYFYGGLQMGGFQKGWESDEDDEDE